MSTLGPLPNQIRMTRGDTLVFDVDVTLGGQPTNITGCTMIFTAKRRYTDPDASAMIHKTTSDGSIVLSNPLGGVATVTLTPVDTNSLTDNMDLHYDVRLIDTVGQWFTLVSGTLSVLLSVSHFG